MPASEANWTNGSAAELAALRVRIADASRIVVLTGAGMSAESGIATFRDALSGLWARFDPARLASEEGFRADPPLVWDWYAERREGVRAATPNAGHLAFGEFARRRPGVLTVVTQNVDDLHQRAGNVETIRLHGDILADRWIDRCARTPGCDAASAVPGRPPRCADCGNRVRPGVVWFGEMLPPGAIDAAERAARAAELMLVVGTSGAVWPAAGLAAQARRGGAFVAILNPHPSEIDDQAHLLLRGTAAQLLPRLFA
ncbi:MAG: NAD-dependent protein deacylase [Piscinibacter sp.]